MVTVTFFDAIYVTMLAVCMACNTGVGRRTGQSSATAITSTTRPPPASTSTDLRQTDGCCLFHPLQGTDESAVLGQEDVTVGQVASQLIVTACAGGDQGLSKLFNDHEFVVALVGEARKCGMEVVISGLTIIEAVHSRTDRARLRWILSGLRIVHVGDDEARAAFAMLIAAGLHSHMYAIDAAAACRRADLGHRRLAELCGDRVHLVAV